MKITALLNSELKNQFRKQKTPLEFATDFSAEKIRKMNANYDYR